MERIRFSFLVFHILFIIILSFSGCKDKYQTAEEDFPMAPGADIRDISDVLFTTATLNGIVFWEGTAPVTDRGFCWSTSEVKSLGNNVVFCGSGFGPFTFPLTGLELNTKYYVSAFATNSVGTYLSQSKTFTTLPSTPLVSTLSASYYTLSSVVVGGDVYSEGLSAVTECGIYFGLISEQGSTGTKIPIGKGAGKFSTKLDKLNAGIAYYAKAYATNSYGTTYGSPISFTMWNGSMNDIEGNIYGTQSIGSQVWMAENLRVTMYNDGTEIPIITSNSKWAELSTPGYCWYNNNEDTYKHLYGALYNWHSVNTGKLCPAGWHVPTRIESATLMAFLSNTSYLNITSFNAAKSMAAKWDWVSSSISGSIGNDIESNNKSGLSALPAGYRFKDDGTFNKIGYNTTFWTSSEYSLYDGTKTTAYNFLLYNNSNYAYLQNSSKKNGYSVRCILDN